MKCDNCELEIDENEDEVIHIAHPVTRNVQTICIPCDRGINWEVMPTTKSYVKPILYTGI